MVRAWNAVLGGLVTLAAISALAAPADAKPKAADDASADTITATLSGSYNWVDTYDPNRPAIDTSSASLTWFYSITVRATPSGGEVVGTPSLDISGKIDTVAAPPNQGLDCTGMLSYRTSRKPTQGTGPVGIVYTSGVWSLDAFLPEVGEWVQSTAPPSSGCGTSPNSGSPSPPCGPSFVPRVSLTPYELPWRHTYSLTGTGPYPKGGVDCWVDGTATLTFTGTGGGEASLPPMPNRFRAKALAAVALEATYQDALYPCIATSATIPLFGLGPPGQIAALGVGAVGGPLCLAYLKTINDLAGVIKDPPSRSYEKIARPAAVRALAAGLPPCSNYSGTAATFCAQFDPAVQDLLAATQRAQAVAGAMRTTIGRESGALAVHDYGAVRRQDKALGGLDQRFRSVQSSEAAAGARVAALMNGAGLPATLTISQAADAVTAVDAGLAKQGLSAGRLHSLLGTPAVGPYDWLLALAS